MILAVFSVVFSMQSCTQNSDDKDVPEKVLTTFNAKFPDARKEEWEMEDETTWEAEFKLNGKAYSANFKTNGDWLETEYEIKKSDIPANILSILNQNFTDYEIDEAEIAESPLGKSYEMEIEVGEEEFEIVIDAQGKLTKQVEHEDDKD